MKHKLNKGQSFIELIGALLIVSLALVAFVSLVTQSVSNSTFSRTKSLATSYTEEAMEWLRSERDTNWNIFYSNTASAVCLKDLSWSIRANCGTGDLIPNSGFKRSATFVRAAGVVTATVVVEWSDGRGPHESVSTTTFTNWKGNI